MKSVGWPGGRGADACGAYLKNTPSRPHPFPQAQVTRPLGENNLCLSCCEERIRPTAFVRKYSFPPLNDRRERALVFFEEETHPVMQSERKERCCLKPGSKRPQKKGTPPQTGPSQLSPTPYGKFLKGVQGETFFKKFPLGRRRHPSSLSLSLAKEPRPRRLRPERRAVRRRGASGRVRSASA